MVNLRLSIVPAITFSAAVAAAISMPACSSASDSTVRRPSGGSGGISATGGSGAAPGGGGTGAFPNGGGSGMGGTGNVGQGGGSGGVPAGGGGSGGGSGGGGGGGACTPEPGTSMTRGVKVSLNVTWPGTLSANAGQGIANLWIKATVSANDAGAVTGTSQPCGSSLPEVMLSAAGAIVTGGTKVLITFPDTMWDAPSMPKFNLTGTQSGWDPGDTLSTNATTGLLGVTMTNPSGSWPDPYLGSTGLTPVDDDGDGKPGVSLVPSSAPGYTRPPTGLGVFGSAPTVDKVYIISRNQIALNGTRTSCTDDNGTANVTLFDNHVVGCHVFSPAGECTATQADFVDANRTKYVPGSATYVGKRLPNNASCADLRAALP